MLKIALVGFAFVVVAFLVAVALQPSTFRVSRSADVAAPPEAVFAEVNDLHRWEAWNPWQKLDPAARNSYSGPTAGEGASFAWDGNGEIGAGRVTIVESRPGELVRIRLEFLKPMAATHTAEFTFEPRGEGTTVTWSMFGTNGLLARAVHLFLDMDEMIGGQFEKGLADMKSVVEAPRAARAAMNEG